MIVGHGIDIMSTKRIRDTIETFGSRFLRRIYTADERESADRHKEVDRRPAVFPQTYTAYWAVKEAAMKALGTGNRMGVRFIDIEVCHKRTGRPYLKLYGKAAEFLDRLGVRNIQVSMSHIEDIVVASVIFES
jgi:holo-[acyl-carrier protein] synthase